MAETTAKDMKAAEAAASQPAEETSTGATSAVDRIAELTDEVLKSVETGQRAAIEAVRKFVDTVDEILPAHGERPSRRETVIVGALEMADKLVTTQYDFLRSVVHNADSALSRSAAARK